MHSQNGNGSREPASSRFRIVCHQANGNVGLLTFCQSLSEARRVARAEVDQHLARLRKSRLEVLLDSKRLAQIDVEQWVGEATNGAWKVVERREGGYQFTFYDSPPRKFRGNEAQRGDSASQKNGNGSEKNQEAAEKLFTPQSGDLVECVLLERRTRKNGWFAKIVARPISGPVTGPAPSARNLEAGMTILLRVCSCKSSTGTAQFAWV